MKRLIIFIASACFLLGEISLTVESDKEVYSETESIHITLTAHNSGQYEYSYGFNQNCESTYFIGDWCGFDDLSDTCMTSYYGISILPDSSHTWTWTHDLNINPLPPGLHGLSGIVLSEGSRPSEPIFIQIGDSLTTLPLTGFFPNSNNIRLSGGCVAPAITLSLDSSDSYTQTITMSTMWSGLMSIILPNQYDLIINSGYYFVYDTTTNYDISASLTTYEGQNDFPFDTSYSVWDTSTVTLYLHENLTIIDSLSRTFEVFISGAVSPVKSSCISQFEIFPNPANAQLTVEYNIDMSSQVDVHIYDILGRAVQHYSPGMQLPGSYSFKWDGTNSFGKIVDSGIYIIQLKGERWSESKKVMLLK